MKLENKKDLVARTLGIGKKRIIFNKERLNEIKEAITKEDVKQLVGDGAIMIREIKGRKKAQKRNNRRRAGSVKKKVNQSKREYIIMVRKLRAYIAELKRKELINNVAYRELRKQIKLKAFKSKANLKGHISLMEKTDERNRKDNTKKKKRK